MITFIMDAGLFLEVDDSLSRSLPSSLSACPLISPSPFLTRVCDPTVCVCVHLCGVYTLNYT